MRKSETMAFRCTEDLKKKIREQANENGIPLSRFIERKLSELDPETIPEVKELKNCFIKTQNEINEIARSCIGNSNFSADDYQKIMEKLNGIDKKYYNLIAELILFILSLKTIRRLFSTRILLADWTISLCRMWMLILHSMKTRTHAEKDSLCQTFICQLGGQ